MQIRNEEKAKQLILFDGLKWERGIRPTDIDAFLDFGDKAFVIVECKYGDCEIPRGQLLALERLCRASESDSRKACVVVARHSTQSPKNIVLKECTAASIYYGGVWNPYHGTVKAAIDNFLEFTRG